MPKPPFNDLLYFLTIVREGSFTRAAASLGITQSALSQTLRALEARLHVRLLTRNTRGVSPTAAGQQLALAISPCFDQMQAALDKLAQGRAEPAGMVRITCPNVAVRHLLLPRLAPLLQSYPGIQIELDVNHGMRNIVAERYDAGVRLGEAIDQDMVAVPIGPPLRMAAVATPGYFDRYPVPQHPRELLQHNCINWRMPTAGGLYVWEFEQGDKKLNVRVDGQLTFSTSHETAQAALTGAGLAFMPEDEFEPWLSQGMLVRVLEDWCPPFPGYHLYYPSRRQVSPAFALVVQALRQTNGESRVSMV